MEQAAAKGDIFDRARNMAGAVLLAAGVAAMLGSILDWVTISVRPELQSNIDFDSEQGRVEEPEVTEPFNGLEATYGYYTLAGGALMALSAVLLVRKQQGRYAFLGLVAAMITGAIAVAAFRGITDSSSGLHRAMDIVGKAEPALGLILVGAAGILGLLASAMGAAATPTRPR